MQVTEQDKKVILLSATTSIVVSLLMNFGAILYNCYLAPAPEINWESVAPEEFVPVDAMEPEELSVPEEPVVVLDDPAGKTEALYRIQADRFLQLWQGMQARYEAGAAPLREVLQAADAYAAAELSAQRYQQGLMGPGIAEAMLHRQILIRIGEMMDAEFRAGVLPHEEVISLLTRLGKVEIYLSQQPESITKNPALLAEVEQAAAAPSQAQLQKLLAVEQNAWNQ